MAAFDEERPGSDELRHFGMAEGVYLIEFQNLVLRRKQVAEGLLIGRDLPGPFIEIARADDGPDARLKRRNAHRRGAAVGEPIQADTGPVDERQRFQPADRAAILGGDEAE